ncbi:MAG: aldose epimerase family protein [Fervidobacterium sp.]
MGCEYGKWEKSMFGQTREGIVVEEYMLINKNGLMAKVLTYGGIIRELWVPNKNGRYVDIVLGYNTLEEYEKNPGFLGTIVGRFANRIAFGRFKIDDVTYQLALNDRGRPNALHGGNMGFHKKVWKANVSTTPEGVKLTLMHLSHDGDEGYPGNMEVTVIYTLTNENEFKIEYFATTDKPTIVNLTQHTYFNLSGGGKIYQHIVSINADRYTPVNEYLIPTGEIVSVENTPFDLRKPTKLEEAISRFANTNAKGFDFNYVLNDNFAASVEERTKGIRMEVYTTQPGIQFYTGNYLPGLRGKYGQIYDQHTGFCLETQHFPDSPNHKNFPNTILRPGEIYKHCTTFKFSTLDD